MHTYDIPTVAHESESYEYSVPRTLSESQELELAAELMEIGSEQEFEQFLGDLFKKAAGAVGGFFKSPIGQAVGSALKGVAKQVLPMAGQALGGMIGGPVGSQLGGQLASAAGGAFGLELEAGEQEFEAAHTFVKLAADAVKNAASAPPGSNPHAVAQAAVTQAVQTHAPSLMAPDAGAYGHDDAAAPGRGRSGRWIRRGSKIILFGV